MKKLNHLLIDDEALLNLLCENHQECDLIKAEYDILASQYRKYLEHKGNSNDFHSTDLSLELSNLLIKLYKSKSKEFSYINKIRKELSPDVCPMCGSLGTGTVDHFLPKKIFPEVAIFSLNLIPACNCNISRKTATKCEFTNGHILHPYFDNKLKQRLITCTFENSYEIPSIKLKPIVHDINITFHVENIINRTNIILWLEKKWVALIRKPSNVIFSLDEKLVDVEILKNSILNMLEHYDAQMETPNNWYSIFFYGLLQCDHDYLSFILEVHNRNYLD